MFFTPAKSTIVDLAGWFFSVPPCAPCCIWLAGFFSLPPDDQLDSWLGWLLDSATAEVTSVMTQHHPHFPQALALVTCAIAGRKPHALIVTHDLRLDPLRFPVPVQIVYLATPASAGGTNALMSVAIALSASILPI